MTTFNWLKLYRTIEEAQVGITASKAIFVYIRARGWKTGYYNFEQPIRQKSPLLGCATKETFVWLAVENCSIQFSNRALWCKQRWLSKRWFQPVLLRSFYIASASWRWSFKLKLTGKDSARGILVGGKFSFVTLFVSSPFSLLGKATPLKLLRVSFYTF